MKIKKLLLLTLILFSFKIGLAQKNTFSPYTRYGVGEILKQGYATNLGIGGISYGFRKNNTLNYLNPASYTVQDTNSFIFDFGLSGNLSQFRNNTEQMNKKTVSLDHVSIGFPVIRWWKSSIGIAPYSHVGYNIQVPYTTTDNETYNYQYQGDGGLRKFYIGNAFQVMPSLSLGVNYSYLFGRLTYNNIVRWPNDANTQNLVYTREKIINGSVLNLGIQYHNEIFGDYKLTVGATYDLPMKMNLEESYIYTNGLDTISSENKTNFNFPVQYGVGFSIRNKKILFGMDFSYQDWAEINEFNYLQNSYSVNAGFEYTPDREALRNYFKHVNYRVGGFYNQSYLNMEGESINNYGITFGLGLPIKYQKTKFNISCQLGRKGTTNNNLIEINYATINFNITFFDFWFIKHKYQ
jgi:hypothetical protein